MKLPRPFLESLESVKGFDRVAFEKVHASGEQVTSIRMNPAKTISQFPSSSISQLPIPWTDYGFYLDTRPSFTFDPLFHAGCYYVQEASSMFLEQALKQTTDLSKPLRVLDLCAAPGGKSTHILSLISKDSLLVSNEVIRSRANILKDNIIKWGYNNAVVTNNDPRDFQKLENYFDVIIVDAPCSGSGLFRKDSEAIEEWSLNNVQLCSQRQQRILADVLPALKEGGVLIYSTCSYSKEEDEEIGKWIMDNLKMENQVLQVEESWGIIESDCGYRFYPDKLKGEGFFTACFRERENKETSSFRMKGKLQKITLKDMQTLQGWVKTDGLDFLSFLQKLHAIPIDLSAEINFLISRLRVVNFGTIVGEIIWEKFVPDHALAMSLIVSENVRKIELDDDKAIQYLKRKELNIDAENKGWHLVTHGGYALGWINVLSNRINNYYPKELRILKD